MAVTQADLAHGDAINHEHNWLVSLHIQLSKSVEHLDVVTPDDIRQLTSQELDRLIGMSWIEDLNPDDFDRYESILRECVQYRRVMMVHVQVAQEALTDRRGRRIDAQS